MRNLSSLAVVLIMAPVFMVGQAQYNVLWSFAGAGSGDGGQPVAGLVFDKAGNLYGTTRLGGNSAPFKCVISGCGTVFELSPNGDGTWTETVLYVFCSHYVDSQCIDGAWPQGDLLLDGAGNLYGITNGGGKEPCSSQSIGCGTVFKLSKPQAPGAPWTEKILYSFCANPLNNTCLDGDEPIGGLTRDASGNLYGATKEGGTGHVNAGTVFELSHGPNGWTETVLYSFCTLGEGQICPDGTTPKAGVTFDKAGNLYGTTEGGGSPKFEGGGTLYELSPGNTGWTETVLLPGYLPAGSAPLGAVSIAGLDRLYATFSEGGPQDSGGVLQLIPGGKHTTFTFNGTNGRAPAAGVLIDSQNATLYGTTSVGGPSDGGTVFEIEAPANETVLYNFCSQPNCTDGESPVGDLIADKSGNLYGTTKQGGSNNLGVVFEVMPPASKKTGRGVTVR